MGLGGSSSVEEGLIYTFGEGVFLRLVGCSCDVANPGLVVDLFGFAGNVLESIV